MSKHSYSCEITMGNMSRFETDQHKQVLESFLASFYCKTFTIEKHPYDEEVHYYYHATVDFTDHQYIKVLRFVESLSAFCLFWRFNLLEIALK